MYLLDSDSSSNNSYSNNSNNSNDSNDNNYNNVYLSYLSSLFFQVAIIYTTFLTACILFSTSILQYIIIFMTSSISIMKKKISADVYVVGIVNSLLYDEINIKLI